jgi:CTP:molybdopterin cytidylyltransferase MocA/molybdenum-dependent DNA-binding transcriptional regulator ModE
MSTGAVIVAAGAKKWGMAPAFSMRSSTLIRRVILTLKAAGAAPIVIVTGEDDQRLRENLSSLGVDFVKNDGCAQSHMIDSIRMGLEEIKDRCDRFFICRADIPLFAPSTLEALQSAEGMIAIPVFRNIEGHPVCLARAFVAQLLSADTSESLHEAIRRSEDPIQYVQVDDEGILSTEFAAVEEDDGGDKHINPVGEIPWQFTLSIRIQGRTTVFDMSTAAFFRIIDATGSLRAACSFAEISEEAGARHIRQLEEELGAPALEPGATTGRIRLTPAGRFFVTRFEEFIRDTQDRAQECFERHFPV